jgi:hypothetical protein
MELSIDGGSCGYACIMGPSVRHDEPSNAKYPPGQRISKSALPFSREVGMARQYPFQNNVPWDGRAIFEEAQR